MFLVPIGGRGRGKFCFGLRSWGMEKGRFPIFFFSKLTLGRNFFSLADFYFIFLDIWQNLVPDGCYGY